MNRGGVTLRYKYDAAGRQIRTIRDPGADAITTSESEFDWAGRLVKQTRPHQDSQTVSTEYSEGTFIQGHWRKRTFYPDGGERNEILQRDRSTHTINGSAVHNRTFGQGYHSTHGYYRTESAGQESVTRYHDLLGRVYRIEYADGNFEEQGYNNKGQLQWTKDADGVTQYFEYSDIGERVRSAILVSGTTQTGIQESGTDRISQTVRDHLPAAQNPHGSVDVERVTTSVWPDNNNPNSDALRTVYSTVRGVRNGQQIWVDESEKITHTLVEFLGDGERKETITHPDGNYTERFYDHGLLMEERHYTSDDWQMAFETYEYDDHLRLKERYVSGSGSTGNTFSYTYFDDDRVETVTTPDPSTWSSPTGSGWERQTTEFEYDEMGRQTKITYHDGRSEELRYYLTGEVEKNWGARTMPVEYEYDTQGRMTKMTTWQEFNHTIGSGVSGAAITEWVYHPERGWLIEKNSVDGNGTKYTYTDAGRLKTRSWAREFNGGDYVTTYTYDPIAGGDLLTAIAYGDSPPHQAPITPPVSYQYNRLGQRVQVTDGSGTRTIEYNPWGVVKKEAYTAGPLSGRIVKHVFDEGDQQNPATGRLKEIKILDGETLLHSQEYLYIATNGRLWRVKEGDYTADYLYLAETFRISSIGFQRNNNVVESSGWELDPLGRVERTHLGDNWWWNAPLVQHYDYNEVNQRTRMSWEGVDEPEWVWLYGYDDRGQLTKAERHWGDHWNQVNDPVQGQDYTYTFDEIGNRTQTTTNGISASYALATGSSSGLNQYAERDVPDVIDVLGFSLYPPGQSTLEVNSVTADHRRQNYFYHQLDNLGNSTSDLYQAVEVIEYDGGNPIAEESGYLFVAQDPEEFVYDADGNLESDGRWEYKWDGENRLIEMEEAREDLHSSQYRRRLIFTYDDQGRKVRTEESFWIPSQGGGYWYEPNGVPWQRHYVYSGFNVIGEGYANPTGTGNWAVDRTYLWGLDLNERLDYRATNGWSSIGRSSGGVGGLLLVTDHDENEAHFVHHDGNGNVTALIDADGNGEISAIYDYDPFGNLIRANGEAADLNPFRFSTKYHHEYYGVYYYGFRFYSPGQGRFLNRDPIGEQGGLNLYAFVGNDPVNGIELLGLREILRIAFAGAGKGDKGWVRHDEGADKRYGSRQVSKAYRDVIEYFEGKCPPYDLRVTGYSWGGWSALQLTHRLQNSSSIEQGDLEVILGLLDPIDTARRKRYKGEPIGSVPDIVVSGINIYQTNGCGFFRCFGPSAWYVSGPVDGLLNLDVSDELDRRGNKLDHVGIGVYGSRVAQFTFQLQ